MKRAHGDSGEWPSADGAFSLLDDMAICRIFEAIAAGHRSDRLRLKDVVSLGRTCKRLHEVSVCANARAAVLSRLTMDLDMVGSWGCFPEWTAGSICSVDVSGIPYGPFILQRNAATLRRVKVSMHPEVVDAALGLPGIRELEIDGTGGCLGFRETVAVCPSLDSLQLNNAGGLLSTSFPALTKLKVADNAWMVVEQVLRNSPAIEQVGFTYMPSEDIAWLGNALAGCRSLRSISWMGCPGTFAGIMHAIRGTPMASGLTELDLKRVDIHVDGVLALTTMPNLTRLRLRIPCVYCVRESCPVIAALLVAGSVHGACRLERVSLFLRNCTGDVSRVLATPRFAAASRLSLCTDTSYPITPPASTARSLRRLSCACCNPGVMWPLFEAPDVEHLTIVPCKGCHAFESFRWRRVSPAIRPITLRGVVVGVFEESGVTEFVGRVGARLREVSLALEHPAEVGVRRLRHVGDILAKVCPSLEIIDLQGYDRQDEGRYEARSTVGTRPVVVMTTF
jgi:hypothetical protein